MQTANHGRSDGQREGQRAGESAGRPGIESGGAHRIGTPLSAHATRVMLLGAGELGKEVIIALQRLGVEVIAVDRYADAPGHQVAHRAHVIDTVSYTHLTLPTKA